MSETKTYKRFGVDRRIEHLLLVITFTVLAITGLVQKFATAGISEWIIGVLGGIESTRIIHRTASILLVIQTVYHFILLGYKLYIQRVKASMMPGKKDIRDVLQFMGHNVGLKKEPPKMGRYNFIEKAEYLAMIWGVFAMGLTGFMMWSPIATTTILPGQFIPAAKVMHGLEAILAVAAIILWHFYNVHIKHWNWSMIRGTLTHKEMEEEHSLELEEIAANKEPVALPPAERKRRMQIYFPVAAILTVAFGFGLFSFLTYKQTTLKTVPPAVGNIQAFQRQTSTPLPTRPPTSTPAPTATGAPQATSAPGGQAATWASAIGAIFQDNCSACHGSGAMGGLNITTYADTMKGGTNGAMIKAGDPDNSSLIKKMAAGHAKVFSDADLAKIKEWIKAGAPEK